jgi:uncharacterized protein (TIGR02597 family)
VLSVNTPPTFTSQPQSRTISLNTSATFTASTTGSPPQYYQWRFNGTNISNATDTSYTVAAAQFPDAGSYSVVVSNFVDTATSADAILTVHPCSTIHVLDISSNSTGGVNITWPTDPGIAYTVEFKNDLSEAVWTTVSSSNAAGTSITYADSTSATQRFYRLTSDCAVSEPAGFIRLSALANSDTFLSSPFVRPIAAAATVSSVAGNTIFATQQYPTAWTPNQFVYAAGAQPQTYYVRFVSGAAQGPVFPITGNDTSTINVDTSSSSLAAVVAGDTFVVEPYWTLNSMFPNGAGVNSSPTLGNRNTEVLFPDSTSSGINLSSARVYLFNQGVWKQVGQGNTDYGDDILPLNNYLIVRHNVPTNTTVMTMGIVDTSAWTISLRTPDGSSGTQQDNNIALARAVTLSLGDSGLISSGAFSASPLPGSRTDELLVFDNASVAKNKSASAIYYYWNDAWRAVGKGNTIVGTNQVFTPGTGVIIRKSTAAQPTTWTNLPPGI